MNFLDACEAHVDQQWARNVEIAKLHPALGAATREELVSEEYSGEAFIIPREVGGRVARRMGELVSWGIFDNHREHGLTVRSAGGWTFCFYQHRNSDQMHVEGCPTVDAQPHGPYGGRDKYDTLFWAPYKRYEDVARALCAMLRITAVDPDIDRAGLVAMGKYHASLGSAR